jgi:hypothetical protein
MGQTCCALRAEDKDEKKRASKLAILKARLPQDSRQLLDKASKPMDKFIEAKVENEEGHGGTGMAASQLESGMEQMDAYLELIKKVMEGFKPSPADPLETADQKLNSTYRHLMQRLKKADMSQPYWAATPENIRSVQRLWISFRDASARLFSQIQPPVDENTWKSWFTEKRIKDLLSINKRIDVNLENAEN